jgi:thiamine biosynthesis lipoprotein
MTELSGKTMGTTWHLKIAAESAPHKNNELQGRLQKRLDEMDAAITNWHESPVTRFNASRSSEWIEVPRELAEMVKFSQELSKETNGAFDVTIAPLVDLWGFGAKGHVKEPPSDAVVAEAMRYVGWQKLEVQMLPPALRKKDPLVEINVSAVADGYAVDELKKLLREAGVKNFLLEVGGAVRAEGLNEGGQPWRVGIQQPFAQQGEPASSVPLHDKSLSTSGVYRQFFEKDGKRYAHVLDARTGRPIEHHLVSVSVITDSCFEADGWDTALLILGPVQGRELATKRGINAMFLEEK